MTAQEVCERFGPKDQDKPETSSSGNGKATEAELPVGAGLPQSLRTHALSSGAIDEVIQRGDDKNLSCRNYDGEVCRKGNDMVSVHNEHGDTGHDETSRHRDASRTEVAKSAHAGADGEQAHVVRNKDNKYVIGDIYLHRGPLSGWRGNVGA